MSEKIITKSPLRYPGGKTRAIKTLHDYFPTENILQKSSPSVIAPFLGGGSFELDLTKQGIHVLGMDNFLQLTVFWNQLLKSPEALSEKVQEHYDNTLTKEKFLMFQKNLREFEEEKPSLESLQSLDIAAQFYAVNRASFSGSTLSGGFSPQAASKRFTQSSIERIKNFHNPLFAVQYMEFEDSLEENFLKNHNVDAIFADPPYLLGTSKENLYGDRGSTHKGFNHAHLHELLTSTSLPFLLTYNDTEAVRSLYKEFNIFTAQWSYGMNASKKSSEIIITNYDPLIKGSEIP